MTQPKALAFDTETGGFDWWDPDQRAFLVTWADADSTHHEDLTAGRTLIYSPFEHALRSLKRGDRLWGHNLKIDLHFMSEHLGYDLLDWAEREGIELWDTLSLARVLLPKGQEGRKKGAGFGLKELDEEFLTGAAKRNDERIEEIIKELGLPKTTPGLYRIIYEDPRYTGEMVEYARQDARSTYDLGEGVLMPMLEGNPWPQARQVVDLERDVTPVIYLAERRGVMLDKKQVTAFKKQFEREEHELRLDIERELGGAPESDDDEALILEGKGSKRSLLEALLKAGVPLTERTESGELSTDKRVLGALAADYPVVANLLEWRRVKRFLNTYIGPMVGRDVIHTEFQQQEAWTGRMSSRRPNMQNWPQRAGKEVRNVLRARPGHVLAVADYAQMEFMIVARYMNDRALIESINNGLDGNSYTASLIWGHDPYYWRKDGPYAEGEQSRKTARHTLYATIYGAGACRVTQQLPFLSRTPYLEPTESAEFLRNRDTGALVPTKPWKGGRWPRPGWQCEEARALTSKIKANLPGYKNLLARLNQKIDDVGYVNTLYGRKNPVSRDKKYVAVAAIVQGTGADLLKLAAVKARKPLEEVGATIVMFTHDELVAEVPIGNGQEALDRLVYAMENAYPDHNPHLKASGHLVTHYGED